jgi:hypothetical protein
MASAIDATKPVTGSPTTQSVRDQFATAKAEITALQTAVGGAGTITGVTAGSGLSGGGTSGTVSVALVQPVPIASGGTNSTTAAAALTALGAVARAGDTMTGALTVNANAAPPQPGLTGPLTVVGVDNQNTVASLDAYGTAGISFLNARHARGTAAAPTALQNGDGILTIAGTGYAATGYGNFPSAAIALETVENFTATAQGTRIRFVTNAIGGASPISSLLLQGNNLTVPLGGAITFGGVGATFPKIVGDAANIGMQLGSGNGAYTLYDNPGFIVLTVNNAGNLTIGGATATKSSGTTWANPSSRDIKSDIKTYDKGLQAVLALRPVTYKFNKASGLPTDDTHIGLVHDETAHMPEMHTTATIGSTSEEPGREVDALDCSAVTWVLVNAVKELAAKIDAIEAALSPGIMPGNAD